MAIKYKKTENHTAGQQIKFTGSGGSMAAGTAPLAGGGGGGGGGGVISYSSGGTSTNVDPGSSFIYSSGAAVILSSTYASQTYTISTDSLTPALVSSGSLPLDLSSIDFASYNSSTLTYGGYYYYSVLVSGVGITILVSPGGGGGGGGNPLAATDSRPATQINLASSLGTSLQENGSISSSVDSASRGSSYNGAYYVFTLSPGDEGTYAFNSQGFDSYMYLHSTANSDDYSGANLISSNDDGGGSGGSLIEFVYDGLASFTGAIEVTSYSPGVSASFTLTYSGVASGGG
jgi:hypothetical protein